MLDLQPAHQAVGKRRIEIDLDQDWNRDQEYVEVAPADILGLEAKDQYQSGQKSQNTGITISSVVPGSPADQAGLKVGDTITTVDGKKVTKGSELVADIASRKPGSKVDLGFVRNGKQQDASVTIADRAKLFAARLNEDEGGNDESTPKQDKFGISVQKLTPDIAEKLDIPAGKGVIVRDVIERDRPAPAIRPGQSAAVPGWNEQAVDAIDDRVDQPRDPCANHGPLSAMRFEDDGAKPFSVAGKREHIHDVVVRRRVCHKTGHDNTRMFLDSLANLFGNPVIIPQTTYRRSRQVFKLRRRREKSLDQLADAFIGNFPSGRRSQLPGRAPESAIPRESGKPAQGAPRWP